VGVAPLTPTCTSCTAQSAVVSGHLTSRSRRIRRGAGFEEVSLATRAIGSLGRAVEYSRARCSRPSVIDKLMPAEVCHDSRSRLPESLMLPAEAAAVCRRWRTAPRVRHCPPLCTQRARRAGMDPVALLRGAQREPLWGRCWSGKPTHCAGTGAQWWRAPPTCPASARRRAPPRCPRVCSKRSRCPTSCPGCVACVRPTRPVTGPHGCSVPRRRSTYVFRGRSLAFFSSRTLDTLAPGGVFLASCWCGADGVRRGLTGFSGLCWFRVRPAHRICLPSDPGLADHQDLGVVFGCRKGPGGRFRCRKQPCVLMITESHA